MTGRPDRLELWTFSDAHVGSDAEHGRASLSEAISDSERGGSEGGPAFEWDLALDMGDMSGSQELPDDAEGALVVDQFRASLRDHSREQVYDLAGNHDRSGLDQPEHWWWRRWVDPLGEHPELSGVDAANRPHAIEGTAERYAFEVGNIRFLMMSDVNEPSQTIGRGPLGGNPGGVVSGDTFAWWVDQVETHRDKILVSAHHYLLKDTTVATGDWEGLRRDEHGRWRTHYHGYKPQGSPRGASYLYFVDSAADSGAFESYLAEHPGAVDVWLGGHTHTHPDDRHGGKSHIEQRWGTWFVNVSALTAHHGDTCMPMSRVWSITEDRARVRCYLHTSDHAPQGWYEPAERTLQLAKTFRW